MLSYLAANSDDEYVKTIKTDQEATSTGSPKPVEGSVQQAKSADKAALQFENVKTTPDGHRVQIVRELQTVPVSRDSLVERSGDVEILKHWQTSSLLPLGHGCGRHYQVTSRDSVPRCFSICS